jgi:hypothetical protein
MLPRGACFPLVRHRVCDKLPRVQNLSTFVRTAAIAGLVVIAGWWTLLLRSKLQERERELSRSQEEVVTLTSRVEERNRWIAERDERITSLQVDVAERDELIQRLELSLRLSRVDHRLARIEVLAQGASGKEPDRLRTVVRFTELGPEGEPLAEGRELAVEGKLVYVESLVVKFDDSYVEQGDRLRGTSICLFRRLFGENQKPIEGPSIDPSGEQPMAYGDPENVSALHRALWERFWEYANDPEFAATLGVRAIHGEAPFIEAHLGQSYLVELRASGGLTIRAE